MFSNLKVVFFLGILTVTTYILDGSNTNYNVWNPTISQSSLPSPLLHDHYIISSELSFGRISNLKISIAEVIGLSIALNRTAIFPKLETCIDENRSGSYMDFNQLFDSSAFSRASVISYSGIDLNHLCGQEAVSIIVSDPLGKIKLTVRNEMSIKLQDIMLSEPFLFGDDVSIDSIFTLYPYDKYFLPRITESWAKFYMNDRMLPDKLATLNKHKCMVLGKNFLSLNWARLPEEFEEVHRELLPISSIRADVFELLLNNELARPFHPTRAISVVPFIGIHLRMGDFLSLDSHRGFGYECNRNPEMIVVKVREISNQLRMRIPIVLATDDYQSNCAMILQSEFPVIALDKVSRFNSQSCQGALFDQEVLGESSFFIGDKMSTFSQSIHQIRTIRNSHAADTTLWL
jgi:hypothetical protein